MKILLIVSLGVLAQSFQLSPLLACSATLDSEPENPIEGSALPELSEEVLQIILYGKLRQEEVRVPNDLRKPTAMIPRRASVVHAGLHSVQGMKAFFEKRKIERAPLFSFEQNSFGGSLPRYLIDGEEVQHPGYSYRVNPLTHVGELILPRQALSSRRLSIIDQGAMNGDPETIFKIDSRTIFPEGVVEKDIRRFFIEIARSPEKKTIHKSKEMEIWEGVVDWTTPTEELLHLSVAFYIDLTENKVTSGMPTRKMIKPFYYYVGKPQLFLQTLLLPHYAQTAPGTKFMNRKKRTIVPKLIQISRNLLIETERENRYLIGWDNKTIEILNELTHLAKNSDNKTYLKALGRNLSRRVRPPNYKSLYRYIESLSDVESLSSARTITSEGRSHWINQNHTGL